MDWELEIKDSVYLPEKGNRQRKPSATKSAAHTMKCLPPAAARNGSATR